MKKKVVVALGHRALGTTFPDQQVAVESSARILADLERNKLIAYDPQTDTKETKRYRAKAILTDEGKIYAKKVTNLIIHATIAGGQGITEKERDIFYQVLFQIADNLNQVCRNLETEN